MDTISQYKQIIEHVLAHYLEPIFDREHGRYVAMSLGWQGARRVHSCLIHIDMHDDKIWIQRDGTEQGIANDLVAAGIPRDRLVLGFYSAATRQHTAFAVA
jgi:XisI protein